MRVVIRENERYQLVSLRLSYYIKEECINDEKPKSSNPGGLCWINK